MGNYDDIINLPHHVSKKHPRLSMEQRAAQFAPFAALTGYDEQVKETARKTSERLEIDEELKTTLDSKIQIIVDKIKTKPKVSITYFVQDLKKEEGEYVTSIGIVEKIDTYNQLICLSNKVNIPINEIIDISGDIFNQYNIN